jgi:hypothetical protein
MANAVSYPVIPTKRPKGARGGIFSPAIGMCVLKQGPSASLGATERKGD